MPFTQDNKKVIDIKNTDTSTQGTWKVITSNDVSHSVKDGTETHATPPSSESLSTARRKHQSARCRNRYAARARTHLQLKSLRHPTHPTQSVSAHAHASSHLPEK